MTIQDKVLKMKLQGKVCVHFCNIVKDASGRIPQDAIIKNHHLNFVSMEIFNDVTFGKLILSYVILPDTKFNNKPDEIIVYYWSVVSYKLSV